MRTFGVPCAALLGLALANAARADSNPPPAKLGKKIDNLTFKDAAGKSWSLHDLKDKKAVVVVFLSFDCPVSKSYSQTLSHLAKTYAPKGVAVVGLTTNDDEDAA